MRKITRLYCPDCRAQLVEGECPVHPAIVVEPPAPDDDAFDPAAELAPDLWELLGGDRDPRAA